jgi:hypothetical protein
LYETLHECKNFGEQLVVSLTHFGLHEKMVDNWARNLEFLRDKSAIFRQIKCEDIWQEENSLKELHTAMSHAGFFIDFERFLASSPVGMKRLKKHSTGEFKKNPFDNYDDLAKDFYDHSFKHYESALQY